MERCKEILGASLLWRMIDALCRAAGRQWRESAVVRWFLNPAPWGKSAAEASIFFRVWELLRGGLCKLYAALKLDRLFEGSVFTHLWIWCAAPVVLAPLLPTMAVLFCAIYMLRASGALELLTSLLAPLTDALGLPAETTALMLLRPLSGSGALAAGSELMARHGPDSYIGRVAAVMLGSTETTFYTVSVYFGAAGIRKTRYTIPAALTADLAGFVFAALTVRWLMG